MSDSKLHDLWQKPQGRFATERRYPQRNGGARILTHEDEDVATRKQIQAIGARLRRLRRAYGYSHEEMAKELNMNRSAYSQYETGERMPSPLYFIDFCLKTGFSLDWIYAGRTEMLQVRAIDRLNLAPNNVPKSTRGRKRRRQPRFSEI